MFRIFEHIISSEHFLLYVNLDGKINIYTRR